MILRVVDGDEFRDIHIEEGAMFLLPGERSPARRVRGAGLT